MSKIAKKEIKSSNYNDSGLRLARQLLGIEHLHFGYFDRKTKISLGNLPAAQKAYVQKILSYIPAKVNNIFDVGCGTGEIARQLVQSGYQVHCVAPDPYLTNLATEKTKGKATVFTDLYENIGSEQLDNQSQDLILMSESCQYIDQVAGWQQNQRLLRKKGYVLIADFFKHRPIDAPNLSKSGHLIDGFIEIAEQHGFTLKKKIDITKETVPTMDLYQGILNKYVFPVLEGIAEVMGRRYPLIWKLLRALFGKKANKIRDRYQNQGSDVFVKYKGYYILLFQKN
ncbi:MAG: methyltransferase domain-containing protein [Leptospiraceae bacterium]|nr:methyltransferase domain-containing protein [Leptospiraceae bacterium]